MRNMNVEIEPSYRIHKVHKVFKAKAIFLFTFGTARAGLGRKQNTYSKATYVKRVAAEKIADIPHPI